MTRQPKPDSGSKNLSIVWIPGVQRNPDGLCCNCFENLISDVLDVICISSDPPQENCCWAKSHSSKNSVSYHSPLNAPETLLRLGLNLAGKSRYVIFCVGEMNSEDLRDYVNLESWISALQNEGPDWIAIVNIDSEDDFAQTVLTGEVFLREHQGLAKSPNFSRIAFSLAEIESLDSFDIVSDSHFLDLLCLRLGAKSGPPQIVGSESGRIWSSHSKMGLWESLVLLRLRRRWLGPFAALRAALQLIRH